MKHIFTKENIVTFVFVTIAAGVGMVIVAPFVAKIWAKLPIVGTAAATTTTTTTTPAS